MNTERVILVSPRKAGTHLAQKLMVLFGYACYGESVPPREGRPALTVRERISMAERFLDPAELDGVDIRADSEEFIRRTDLLFIRLAQIWQIRLAGTEVPHVDLRDPGSASELKLRPGVWRHPFSWTPPGLCWIFHTLDIWRTDPSFLHEWHIGPEPAMVLNYRDPRDALVSMVDFFSDRKDFRRHPESAVFRPIMESLPTREDRITYALTDPAFPLLRDYEHAVSFLHHPRVCTVSFEELVGPEGGGSRSKQRAAVNRVAEHLGLAVEPEPIAANLFDRASFTFRTGQIGGWRDAFTTSHRALFERRFGHLREVFGYE